MGIRNSVDDEVFFIYNSVTGIPIGRSFDDEYQMRDFIGWVDAHEPRFDLRKMTLKDFDDAMREFLVDRVEEYTRID